MAISNSDLQRVGLTFEADGAVNFRRTLSEINADMKESLSVYKLNQEMLDKNATSADKYRNKLTYLNSAYDNAKDKVTVLTEELRQMEAQEGTSTTEIAKKRTELNNATRAMEGYEKSIDKVSAQLKNAKWDDAAKSLKKFGDGAVQAGKDLMPLTLAIGAIAGISVNTTMQFGAQMSRVQAISGATGDEFEALKQQAKDLGASTMFSASEAAEGMENLASAGFDANETMKAMPGLLDLAIVSGGDLALASESAATAIRQFNLEASEAGRVADVYARAAADTNAETVDMAEAMKYVGPVAASLNMSIEESAAAIGILSDAGIKGGQAGTTLRSSLTRLTKPTDAMTQVMKNLGLEFFNAEGEMKPFGDILAMLEDKTADLTQEQKSNALATLFGMEAVSGMNALIGAGSEKYNDLTNSLVNSKGAAAEMAAVISDNLKGDVDEMSSAFESASITIGETLEPVLRDVVQSVTSLLNGFTQLNPAMQMVILVIGGILAAIGPLLIIVGTIATKISAIITLFTTLAASSGTTGVALSSLVAPITAVIAIVALLILAITDLWKNNEDFRKALSEAWAGIIDTLTNAWENTIKPIFESIMNIVTDVIDKTLKPLWDTFKDVLGKIIIKFTELWTKIKPVVDFIFNALGVVLPPIIDALGVVFGAIFGGMGGVLDTFLTTAGNVIGNVLGIFGGIIDFLTGVFTGDWEKVWSGLVSIVDNVIGGVVEVVKWPINTIIGFINGFIKGINKVKIPSWVPLVGGKGISIPLIPKLAKGGDLFAGAAIVGEAGPELLTSSGGRTSVTPLDTNRANSGEIIDYSRLAQAMVQAFKDMDFSVDERGIARLVDNQLIKVM